MSTPTSLVEYLEHFRDRTLQDALAEAAASYWLRRAEVFSGLSAEECDQIAAACRHRSTLCVVEGDDR